MEFISLHNMRGSKGKARSMDAYRLSFCHIMNIHNCFLLFEFGITALTFTDIFSINLSLSTLKSLLTWHYVDSLQGKQVLQMRLTALTKQRTLSRALQCYWHSLINLHNPECTWVRSRSTSGAVAERTESALTQFVTVTFNSLSHYVVPRCSKTASLQFAL